MVSVYQEESKDFLPQVEISGCYVEYQGRFLFLKNAAHKKEPHRWGVPAGKFKAGETPKEALYREVKEEIGVEVSHPLYVGKLFVKYPHFDFIYHIFYHRLPAIPQVVLSEEHQELKWVTLQEALHLPLISATHEEIAYVEMFLRKNALLFKRV